MKDEIGLVTGFASAEKPMKSHFELSDFTCINETNIIQVFLKAKTVLAMKRSF
jgi:hypothetical protein